MKRSTLSVALLGVAEEQSRALVAATTVIASRLPADLQWESDASRADIIVLNTGDPEGQNLAARFAAENDAVLVPYSEAGECPEDGIGRPLRMSRLQQALTTALRRALERDPPSQEEVGRRSYRGRVTESAPKTPRAGQSPDGFARVYRGRSV